MYKKPLFWDTFFLIVVIAFFHVVGAKFYLYWAIPWYDLPMHFLGGLWIGLASLWFFYISDYVNPFKKGTAAMVVASLFPVLIIGLGWEIFEFMVGLTELTYLDNIDTLIDIGMDILGGIMACIYFKWRVKDII